MLLLRPISSLVACCCCRIRALCCVVPVLWCGITLSQTAETKRGLLWTSCPSLHPACRCLEETRPSLSRFVLLIDLSQRTGPMKTIKTNDSVCLLKKKTRDGCFFIPHSGVWYVNVHSWVLSVSVLFSYSTGPDQVEGDWGAGEGAWPGGGVQMVIWQVSGDHSR